MSNQLPELTIEVRMERVPGTRMRVFHTRIEAGQECRVMIEDHAGEEHLNEFLLGVSSALQPLGYHCPHLRWPYPETFGEPSGVRWRLKPGLLPDPPEELSATGEVLRV